MNLISKRLRSLEPEIIAIVAATTPGNCRRLALFIAEKAARYAKIHDNPVILAAIEALRNEKIDESREKQALLKLARDLDDAELDLEELIEQGQSSTAEQTQAIAKARAVDALVSVFEADPEEALADTVYEAYFAVDASTKLIVEWLQEYTSGIADE